MPSETVMQAWVDAVESWDDDALLGESEFHIGLRHALPARYAGLTTEQLGGLAAEAMAHMTPEEARDFESWLSSLGRAVSGIGKALGPAVSQLLPAAAPIVGTIIGGPAGAAVGQMVGQAFSGGGAPAATVAPPPAMLPVAAQLPATQGAAPGAAPVATAAGASSATAQLMSFLQNPALLLSLARQLLGIASPAAAAGAAAAPAAAESVPVPFGALMDTLVVLANGAAEEAATLHPQAWSAESTSYLTNGEGELGYDPAVPEERARAVLEQLRHWSASAAHEHAAHEHAAHEHAAYGYAAHGAAAREDVTAWLARAGLLA